jgi:peptide deformylase
VVCNPVLELPEGRERRLDDGDEGCLSLPGAFVPCARPDFATVRGVDHEGRPVEFSGDGLLARCLQHETDHLHGMVFGDRLGKRARKKLFNDAEKNAAYFPPGWPAGSE